MNKCTVLSPGGDVCSRSVVVACDRTVPVRHDPVPVSPVVHSVSYSPAVLCRESVSYAGETP
jgi:hypothetical protein